ncbi:PASTA domain protein [Corynebacterium efficiens YS-314]|uniref:non-specific serine/threonine protein kinase n=1 Tax=Corynebacterium efficiens (strain DSM 44549 / YS-314 / AJ 12310 / JCM 11189 / NBRC 100395) TaxID=196164 RepID=Q8FNS3_COREF|nr:Stk1 family PASTA domain-containing Ser/Thr kinase [Corynebacterium efficiens]EEW49286.1 PASTA domain protein [Corynebacterium efficiens YS-314]BAC18880.1 putative eukaryotic-type serine/threonine protein kinase [Corynebacterium efficiens YS-314]
MVNLRVGDVLEDRYRIETPIARGGMSTVYRCIDLRLGRSVAVKVMDAAYVNDPVFRQRFRREARSMAQLSHPNLVNVFDFSSSGDHAFIVMELITGGTLRELLAERGPMPPHAAIGVMRGVLTGLTAAHRAGMVHRDIKPDNVLITRDHRVKLSDFGLVRAASAGQSRDDKIVGTVAYLSPEQVEGTEIGPASDVYSAGIVLFELLTGTTPFDGADDMDHAYARLTEVVPAPSSLIDGIPSLVDALVATATALNPEDRFSDASEFLTAMEDVARELNLPGFKVPAPVSSAANRADAAVPEAQPTDMFTTHLPQVHHADDTSVIPLQADPNSNETSILPAHPEPPGGIPVPVPEPPPPAPRPETALQPEGGSAPASEQLDIQPVTNRSKAKLAVWIALITLLIAGVAIGGWWFGSGRYGDIPQVLGLEEYQAVAVVEEAGFIPVTDTRYHNEVPAGSIIGTDPSFGERLPRGEDVTILVSQGRPVVPDLGEDRSVETVRSALEDRTFVWVDAPGEYSDDIPEGQVASTTPPPGTDLDIGSHVQVHLSRGPAPVVIPDVSGMGVDQATRVLENAGINVERVEEAFDPETPRGRVFATSPDIASEVSRGDEIVLRVSNAIEVPDVLGLREDEALEALAEAGVTVASTSSVPDEAARTADTVVAISPEAGELINPADPQVRLGLAGQVEVPSLLGRRVDDARDYLEDIGLTLVADGNDDDDRILTQSPRARSAVPAGSEVEVRAL